MAEEGLGGGCPVFAGLDFDQILAFFVSENAGFGDEAQSERDLERKTGAAAGDDIYREFSVLPELELVLRHVEITSRDLAQPDIGGPDDELAIRITHRRRPVAAPAGLVEHQFAVVGAELVDDLSGFGGYFNPWNFEQGESPQII